MVDIGPCTPMTMLAGTLTSDGILTALINEPFRMLILSLSGWLQTTGTTQAVAAVNGNAFWGEEIGAGSGLSPLLTTQLWVPMEAGDVLTVEIVTNSGIGQLACIIGGVAHSAYGT